MKQLGKLILCLFVALFSTTAIHAEIQLKAESLEMGNLLKWSTDDEKSIIFIIERSSDGIDFENIGEIKKDGHQSVDGSFRYFDLELIGEKAFYRIKEVDQNENFSLSRTAYLSRKSPNNFKISEMSNLETSEIFTLSIQAAVDGILEYQISNLKGEELLSATEVLSAMVDNIIEIDLSSIPKNTYRLKLQMESEVETLFLKKATGLIDSGVASNKKK